MAYAIAWIAILFLSRPLIARSDLLSPLLSPIFDDVCEKVECGKGTCKPSDNSTWFYECECDPGWMKTRFDQDDHLQFLPCVVPNCTVNFSCTAAPSPVQEKASKDNQSIFDPCFWADCGGGSCKKTSQITYSCACAEGYNNLLNVSTFPCYKDCAIGMDCSNLGIMVSNKPAAPTPVMAGNGVNQASSALQGKFLWLVALMMLLAMIEWYRGSRGICSTVMDFLSWCNYCVSCLIYLAYTSLSWCKLTSSLLDFFAMFDRVEIDSYEQSRQSTLGIHIYLFITEPRAPRKLSFTQPWIPPS